MKISWDEYGRIIDGIAYTLAQVITAYDGEPTDPTEPDIIESARNIGMGFLESIGVTEVSDDDDDIDDIPDDVDETNYNPYIGCDEYDDYPMAFDGEDYM